MRLDLLRHGDWFGILFMAVGLGSLIAVLEEGERKDWFTADWIVYCTIIAAICIPAFVIIELWRTRPFINLRLLARPNIGASAVLGLIMGMGLYGSVYILPVYLSQVQGYDAQQIGQVVMWAGAPQLLIIPFVPWFMKRFDLRLLVGFGFLLFGISCLMNGYMSHDTAEPQLVLPQLVRALGQPFIIVPLSALATGGVERAQQADASSLFNIFRNFGGSLGISMLSTITTIREHYHFEVISERLTVDSVRVQEWLHNTAATLAPKGAAASLAMPKALGELEALVRREAFTMTYADCFFGLGVALILAIGVLVLIPRPRPVSGPAIAH